MPLVLAVIVLIIYSSFFLYNRCIAQQDAWVLCIREGIRKDAGSSSVPSAQRILKDEERQRGTKYIAVQDWKGSVFIRGRQTEYSAEGTCRPPVMETVFSLNPDIWIIRVHAQSEKKDPPLLIRKYRRRQYILKEGVSLLTHLQPQEEESADGV